MCEPTTLIIAATAVGAAGAAYAGYQGHQQAKYQAAVATQNAGLERAAAIEVEEKGKREELKLARQIAATRSAQIAAFAANGFDTSSGSAADVVGDTLSLGLEDMATLRKNTQGEVRSKLISAVNYESQASAARSQASAALVTAGLNVTGTILGGAGQLQGMKAATSAASAASTAKPTWVGTPGLPFGGVWKG